MPSPTEIVNLPHVLVGSVERLGIAYITVLGDAVDAFAPVVARLTGT